MDGNFLEAKESRVELLEDDLEVFKEFQYWLYIGELSENLVLSKLPPKTEEDTKEIEQCVKQRVKVWKLLIELYAFADKRMFLNIHNKIMDGFSKQSMLTILWRTT